MDDQNNGFNKPVNNQPMYDGQTGQRLVSPNNNNNNNQLKKTILMIVAIALVAAACGGLVYIKVFKKTHVNLTKNMSVRYSGVSGNAYTTSSMVSNQFEYDESNEKLRDFYRSVVYTFDKSSGLSNGDMVKVTAKYNTELADRLRLQVDKNTKSFKVKGLPERFLNGSKIKGDILSEIKAEANSKITQMAASASNTTFNVTAKLHSLYFGRYGSGSYNGDAIIAVASAKLKYLPTGKSHTYYFYTYTTSKVDTDYLKNNHYWLGNIKVSLLVGYVYGYGYFLIDSGKLVSDPAQILPRLQASSAGSYRTLTKING